MRKSINVSVTLPRLADFWLPPSTKPRKLLVLKTRPTSRSRRRPRLVATLSYRIATMSASNLLNRQIMRSYSRHKTSLNTPLPEAPTPSTSAVAIDSSEASPVDAPASSVPTGTASPTPKRKLRAAGDQDSSSKRSRSVLGPSRKGKEKHVAPTARLSDLGGVNAVIEQLLEHVALPICHPEIYDVTGIRPSRGVLLCGPPGCGKTMLANALAGELGVPFISISAPSVVSGMSGESEKAVRDTFEEAAVSLQPLSLSLDAEGTCVETGTVSSLHRRDRRDHAEARDRAKGDGAAHSRPASHMSRRCAPAIDLLQCWTDVHLPADLSWDKTEGKPVIVIGATNRPDSLDPALRRGGRFDQEISMGVPDEAARESSVAQLISQPYGRLIHPLQHPPRAVLEAAARRRL